MSWLGFPVFKSRIHKWLLSPEQYDMSRCGSVHYFVSFPSEKRPKQLTRTAP